MACALLAVCVRAIVPAGYMATVAGDRISVTLCGSGASAILDLGDHGSGDRERSQPDGVCVFAMASAAAPPPAPAIGIAAPISAPVVETVGPPAAVAVGQGLAAPPPPSHAPPILA